MSQRKDTSREEEEVNDDNVDLVMLLLGIAGITITVTAMYMGATA